MNQIKPQRLQMIIIFLSHGYAYQYVVSISSTKVGFFAVYFMAQEIEKK